MYFILLAINMSTSFRRLTHDRSGGREKRGGKRDEGGGGQREEGGG